MEMSRLRKCNRRYLLYAFVLGLIFLLTTHLISDFVNSDIDNNLKL